MSENPTDAAATEPEQAAAVAQQAPDGEGFGGPNSDADRVGPAGSAAPALEGDPEDDAGMVSG
jgi:hypothetical protein